MSKIEKTLYIKRYSLSQFLWVIERMFYDRRDAILKTVQYFVSHFFKKYYVPNFSDDIFCSFSIVLHLSGNVRRF